MTKGNNNCVSIVRQTWDERFKMYMKMRKKELAAMLTEIDKYTFPEGCKEFEKNDEANSVTMSASTYTYSSKIDEQ